ncbi:MAG TPA: PAS domain-containing protein [Anaeromyxobacteraceae bacterium]|nr:PAS domain-containing protein [Anaeromyxobacteraceae bacterium]
MRVICSFCHAWLRDVPGGTAADVSHGMCEPCAIHFQRLWEGMHLGEYLDDLTEAVIVVDADRRVLAANAKATALLGRDPAAPRGLLTGEAVACARSRLPGGCGNTVHCRECAIRSSVTRVQATGRPVKRAPAFLKTDAGKTWLTISARKVGDAIEVTLQEGAPPPEEPR